jgi:hypothetical protein
LAEESERAKTDLPDINRYFRIDSVTNETVYLQQEDRWSSVYDKSFWNLNKTPGVFKITSLEDIKASLKNIIDNPMSYEKLLSYQE